MKISTTPWRVEGPLDPANDSQLDICDAESARVATVYGWSEFPEMLAAEARLIAAAPELLEACLAVKSRLDYLQTLWGQEGVTRGLVDQITDAIAKATGGRS